MGQRLFPTLLLLSLGAWIALSSAVPTPEGIAAEDEVKLQRNVVYGRAGETPLTLNIARPVGVRKRVPAVLLFHGGGWAAGRKERHDDLVVFLAERGYVAATVFYRLAPMHPWPAQIEDAKCAVRWMRAHAKEWGVDPQRIAALGFSAGAHLSMLLGTMEKADGLHGDAGHADEDSKVQAVVSFFGPTELGKVTEGIRAEDLTPERLKEEFAGRVLGRLLGPAFRKDPKKASPLTYVSEGDAPMLLVQGTRDPLVPYVHATRMMDALTEARVPGEVVFWLGLGHGWGEPQRSDSVDLALRFLERHFQPRKKRSLRDKILGR